MSTIKSSSLSSILDDYLKIADTGILSIKSTKSMLGLSSAMRLMAKPLPEYELGFFSQDGEDFYILFDSENGDMEFSSKEALRAFLKSKQFKTGSFEWVTDNEPVELDCIEWFNGDEDEKIIGRFVLILGPDSPFVAKPYRFLIDYENSIL